ncbi:MAG TPA: protein translocase subunit SecF [Candidatus Limnocylindrales bacterium]|nr:protein translocase subunit SecF [Candidatus Limnocylindrales bacterium]
MFDIIGRRRWYYLLSALVILPGLIFTILTPLSGGRMGLQFSIDFTGGTVWEVHFRDSTPTPDQVRGVMEQQGLTGSVALTTSQDRQYVLIRTEPIGLVDEPAPTPPPSPSPDASPSPDGTPAGSPAPGETPAGAPSPAGTLDPAASPVPGQTPALSPDPSPAAEPTPAGAAVAPPTQGRLGELREALEADFGPIDEVRQEATIGPVISAELGQQAIILIVLGSAGILGWMTFRFSDYRMGAVAIAALIHDVLLVVGVFAILGTLFGLQIDALFVTAMLTVIGFSVHDTIVVFDRIRENRVRHAGEPFDAIVNHSLLQTLGRSLNTSITTVLVLLGLMLLGSEATRPFIFAMVIGITAGAYSSIFNAAALLVDWNAWSERRRAREFATARPR